MFQLSLPSYHRATLAGFSGAPLAQSDSPFAIVLATGIPASEDKSDRTWENSALEAHNRKSRRVPHYRLFATAASNSSSRMAASSGAQTPTADVARKLTTLSGPLGRRAATRSFLTMPMALSVWAKPRGQQATAGRAPSDDDQICYVAVTALTTCQNASGLREAWHVRSQRRGRYY
jgi:hypothetical protein